MSEKPSYEDLEARIRSLESEIEARSTSPTPTEPHDLFRELYDEAPIGIFQSTLDGQILRVNPAFARLFGFESPDQVVTLEVNAETVYVDPARRLQFIEQAMKHDRLCSFENQFRRRDGDVFWANLHARVARDPDGTVRYFEGFVEDISERKRAESELSKSERKYRTVLESIQDGYFEVDLDGNIIFFNDALARLLRCSPEELSGSNYRRYMDEENAVKMYDVFHRVYQTGEEVKAAGWKMRRVDGTALFCESAVSSITDHAGRVIGFRGLARDVTEHIRSKEDLRRERDRAQMYLDTAEVILLGLNERGEIELVNQKGFRLLGYEESELVGRNWFEVCLPERFREAVKAVFADLMAGRVEPVEYYENPVITRSGKERIISWHNALLRDSSGRIIGTLSSGEDVTESRRAQQAIRDSEERYRVLFELATDGIFLLQDDRLVDCNAACLDLFWATKEEIIGTSPLDWSPEIQPDGLSSREKIENVIARVQAGEKLFFEWLQRRRDGSLFNAEVNLKRIDLPGQPYILGIVRDVTARKIAERELRESRERIVTLLSNMPGMAYRCRNDEQWTMLIVSDGSRLLTGHDPSDLVQNRKLAYEDLIHPDDRAYVRGAVDQALAEDRPFRTTYRLITADGEEKWVWEQGRRVVSNGEDFLEGFITDVSDRVRADRALQESERRYRLLVENAPLGIISVDRDGWVIDANSTFVEIVGAPDIEATKKINVLTRPILVQAGVAEYFRRCIEEGRRGVYELPHVTQWGKSVHLRLHLAPILDSAGAIVGAQGVVEEISSAKKMEQQLIQAQKMQAIGTLAGGIAHDFNNLLMSIEGHASLLLMDLGSDHPSVDSVRTIEEAVQRGTDLTRQLLGFARGGKYEVKTTNVVELVEKSSKLFGRTKKEIRIHLKHALDVANVEVDRGQIEQVLLNMFVNAWQAMPEGGDLYLDVNEAELASGDVEGQGVPAGRYVKISVTDTGVGMDEATRLRIFEPFFTTKTMGRGTGLGLASAYGIVKNHGGFITVYSEPGSGSTFNVYLPASERAVAAEPATAPRFTTGSETVLVVDDEELILDVAKQMLGRMGYRVFCASSGAEALKTYEVHKEEIDLVILDMIMPGMSGEETCDRLHGIDPTVKILLSSGYSLNGRAGEILRRGCRGFIQKPFNMKALSAKVRDVLNNV